jgi:hypothetical protein
MWGCGLKKYMLYKARETYPLGYKTLDYSEGFSRKTLTFRCNEKIIYLA